MTAKSVEINDLPTQYESKSLNHVKTIFNDYPILSPNSNNEFSIEQYEFNQEFLNNLPESFYFSDKDGQSLLNHISSIDYNNIKFPQNIGEKTQEKAVYPSQVKPFTNILQNKQRKNGKQDSNKIKFESTKSKTKKNQKNSTGRHKKKKFFIKKVTSKKIIKKLVNEEKKILKKKIHTKNYVDNAKRKVFTHTKKNIHILIKKLAKKYKGKGVKLYEPSITPQMKEKRCCNLIELSEYSISKIYIESSGPKNPKAKFSSEGTKKIINELIQKEEEDQNAKTKILKIIFNKTLREFIFIYLTDAPFLNSFGYIFKKGEEINLLDYVDEFKTYKDDMNDIDEIVKNRTKDNLFGLLKFND
jgi:hypothetical protein